MILNEIIKQIHSFLSYNNDDPIDRLHYIYSVLILSIYLLFISSKQFYGELIQCATPNAINADASKYIHSMCWMNGTFHVDSPKTMDFENQKNIYYYQWLIVVILVKILSFRLPTLVWKLVIHLNGFNLSYVTQTILSQIYLDEYMASKNWVRTQEIVESISDHLRMTFLKQKKKLNKKFNLKLKCIDGDLYEELGQKDKANVRRNFPNLKTKPTFPLFFPYLFIKQINLLVIIFNFVFLSAIFRFNYLTYPIEMFNLYMSESYTGINRFFPKRGFCDVNLTTFQNENPVSVLCSLPVNLYNEIFYICYWFWLLYLIIMNFISISYWILITIRPYRRNLVLKALQLSPKQNISSSYTAAYYFGEEATLELADSFLIEKTGMSLMENFNLFFKDVCSIDVIFTVKMISLNSNSLAQRDLLNNLWDHYLDLEDLKLRDVNQRPVITVKRPYIYPRRFDQKNETNEETSEA